MKKLAFLCALFISSTVFGATTYNGIDVSKWSGTIDFTSVKDDNIDIVYIRAAYGGSYEDPNFSTNYTSAKDADLKIGFYHYITATSTSEAETQAEYFYNLIKDKDQDCVPVMDFELTGLSDSDANEIAEAYLSKLESLMSITPMIYSNESTVADVFDSSLTKYLLWIAEYGVTEPKSTGNWDTWDGFQYSDTGSVSGISGNVDMDYFKDTVFIDYSSSSSTSTTSTTSTSSSTSSSSSSSSTVTYTIKRGDTLSSIAKKYDTTVNKISELNNISNPDLIYSGETLIISE
ncbi:MAG: hypothetical protein ATN35_09085 [Epulopiscium sp. Nele67-Bin004]|nr:MAG: hypothetical protein ATN35_09085 [Epulopiscium sp. Nele67-Bin004]